MRIRVSVSFFAGMEKTWIAPNSAIANPTLRKEARKTIYEDTGWVVLTTALAAGVILVQATPAAPVVDAGIDVAATDAAASTTVAGSAEVAEEAAVQARTATAVAKASRLNGPLLTAGTAFIGSLVNVLHGWTESNSTSSPFFGFKLAKMVTPGSIEGDTTVTVNIPIEDYAQDLNSALNSEY
jgi:hypothetical protein